MSGWPFIRALREDNPVPARGNAGKGGFMKDGYSMSSVWSVSSSDLALDLATAPTLVFARATRIVLNEPSLVAINTNSGEVVAVSKEAKAMLAPPPPHDVHITPMKARVIADLKVTEKTLTY